MTSALCATVSPSAHDQALEQVQVQESSVSYTQLVAESHPNLQKVIKEGVSFLCGDTARREMLRFSPLDGGFSSSNLFVFSVDGQRYVLRVLDPNILDNPAPTLNKRMREVLAHRAASEQGLAPELIYTDANALILIMRYIDGHTLSREDFKEDSFLLELGSSLRRFHQSSVQLPEKRTQLDRAKKHYESAKQKGIAFPSNFNSLYELFMKEGELAGEEMLCHGDLHAGNILVRDGKPYFIDFAGATYDHPFTDIGYLTLLSGMSSEQAATFLKGYLGRSVTADEEKMLELAQTRICFLTSVVWFDYSETEDELKKPLQERVDRLDVLLAFSPLKTGHEYILEGRTVNPSVAPAREIQQFALGFLKEHIQRRQRLLDRKQANPAPTSLVAA